IGPNCPFYYQITSVQLFEDIGMDPVIMDGDMESVLTDLSSELATNKDYPSTSELSEPPELNPISNEDDTNSLTSEDEDHDSDSMDLSEEDLPLNSTDSSESSEEDIPLSSNQRSPIDAHEHSTFAINKELDNSTRQNKRELTDKKQSQRKLEDNHNNLTNLPPSCRSFLGTYMLSKETSSQISPAKQRRKRRKEEQQGNSSSNFEALNPSNNQSIPHVQDSDKVSKILWKLFHKIGNVALLANQQFMVGHNLPAFSDSQIPGRNSGSSKDFFSTNLTFTSHGFSNHPHKDTSDEPKIPFAFLLVIPTRKSTGQVALEIKGYNGQMVL
ncbi:hypothetical protein PSHT_10348, partial [Puccinia striiformis]